MTKKTMFIVAFLCGLLSVKAQTSYTVKAKIDNPNNYKMCLMYIVGNNSTIDTNYVVENDIAIFKGSVEYPLNAYLNLFGNPATEIKVDDGYIPGPVLTFFLSNDTIEINGTADEIYAAEVKGGEANAEWNQIKTEQNALIKEEWLFAKRAYKNLENTGETTLLKELNAFRKNNSKKITDLQLSFIQRNPNSLVSMYFLSEISRYDLPFKELKKQYNQLGNKHKNSIYAQDIATKIVAMEATAIGKPAIPIRKKDLDGQIVDLQTLKGKYVLLDFWGSWCQPCRASHPHLLELYDKYKDYGFEIIGIAQESESTIEEMKSTLRKAIKEDKLTWRQVLNNENIEEFDAVKAYDINALPTKILLDKEGKIILRNRDLDKKLKEIFGF